MRIIYAQEPIARAHFHNAIFLAGPTLRTKRCRWLTKPGNHELCDWCKGDPNFRERSWRQDVIDRLSVPPAEDVTLFVPEFSDWRDWTDADKNRVKQQDAWEISAMASSCVVLFWVPRDMDRLPGLTTNLEFGYALAQFPRRIVLGAPPNTPGINVMRRRLTRFYGIDAPFYFTLEETLNAALRRTYGDCL